MHWRQHFVENARFLNLLQEAGVTVTAMGCTSTRQVSANEGAERERETEREGEREREKELCSRIRVKWRHTRSYKKPFSALTLLV